MLLILVIIFGSIQEDRQWWGWLSCCWWSLVWGGDEVVGGVDLGGVVDDGDSGGDGSGDSEGDEYLKRKRGTYSNGEIDNQTET